MAVTWSVAARGAGRTLGETDARWTRGNPLGHGGGDPHHRPFLPAAKRIAHRAVVVSRHGTGRSVGCAGGPGAYRSLVRGAGPFTPSQRSHRETSTATAR